MVKNKGIKKRILALAMCFFVSMGTLFSSLDTYAAENPTENILENTAGYDGECDEEYDGEYGEDSDVFDTEFGKSDAWAGDDLTDDREELSGDEDEEEDEAEDEALSDTPTVYSDEMADTETENDEILYEFDDEELDVEGAVAGGGTLSGHIFYSKYSANLSWRDNWFTRSMANYDRLNGYEYDTERTFKKICVNQLANKSVDCSGYVSNVLIANGEMASGGRQTTKTFESWLTSNDYYSVLGGDYIQLVSGSTSNKTYTSNAESVLANVQSGDILLWANEGSDGSFTPAHVSIGYVYDGDTLGGSVNSKDTFYTGEVCMFQSNGVFKDGVATVDIESVAYYLSGANSGTSYGSALKIFRKKSVSGSIQVSKSTDTGENKGGVVFGLYKVSYSGYSLLNKAATSLKVSSLNLSGLNDATVSGSYDGKTGILTRVATFTTNSSGVGVPKLTSGIVTAHNNAVSKSDYGSDWYRIAVDTSANKITGLPIGDYIIIEEKDTIGKACWKKGGSYGGVTLDDNTVNCQFTLTAGDSAVSKNGMQSGTSNSLCDFGFGQGKQYYGVFSVENSKDSTLRRVNAGCVNINKPYTPDTPENPPEVIYPEIKVKKSSTMGYAPDMTGITYGVYEKKSDAEARNANYAAKLVLDKNGDSAYQKLPSVGTYYIIELSTNSNYFLSNEVYTTTFTRTYTTESRDIDMNELYKTVSANDAPKMSLSLLKKSGNTSVTTGNTCYDITGATYAVYSDTSKKGYAMAAAATEENYSSLTGYVGKLVTDKNGNTGKLENLTGGVYYVKEVIAPEGYALDENVYLANLADTSKLSGNLYTLEVTDKPQMNPCGLLLTKLDSSDDTPVAGAEFTVEFYAGEYDDEASVQGKTPERTWVLSTDEEGLLKADDEHKISGDEWYVDQSTGKTAFPLGTLIIRETSAPTGYEINKEVFIRRITAEKNVESVNTYNAFTVKETPVPTIKTSATDANSGTGTLVADKTVTIYDDVYMTDLVVGKTYKIRGVLMDKETGEELISDGKNITAETEFTAEESEVTVRMEYVFDASALAGRTTVVFEDLYVGDRKVAAHNDLEDEGQTIYIDYTKVVFAKVDADTKKPLAGAALSLYDSEGTLVEGWISDEENHIINNLLPGTYTLTEDASPAGYWIAESVTFDVVSDSELFTITMEDEMIKGSVHITKVDNVDNTKTLAGVTFKLFKTSGDEEDKYIDTYVTDENGEITVENLSYGSYYFIESQTLENYDLMTEIVDFDIDGTHTDNEIIVTNVGREGWVVLSQTYQPPTGKTKAVTNSDKKTPEITTENTPEERKTVKTGDEMDVVLVLVVMMMAAGVIVVLVRRRKKVEELLVISATMCLVGGACMSFGGKNVINAMAEETATVEMTGSIDTAYCEEEPEHEPYIMETYTDSETGISYDVKLDFTESECVESGFNVPTVLTGTIYDYDSVYIVYNGKHYEASCDDISTLDELIKDFVSDAGYAEGSYENMTYSYIDAAYTDEYGISYRDFKVSFNAYGNRYSFHYAGSIEIPAHTSTEDASTSQNSAVQDSTPQNSAVQDSTPQNSAVQEDVPQNSVVQDSTSQNSAVQEGTQQNSVSQSATSTVSETVTNTDTANESSSSAASKNEANTAKLTGEAKDKAGENTDLLDDLGRWLAIAIVVSVLFGMAISYIYMKKRGRTVVTVDR